MLLVSEKMAALAGAAANVIVPVDELPPIKYWGLRASELCGAVTAAIPPGKGRYSGSPIFNNVHFSHFVLRKTASPTFAPSNRFRNMASGWPRPPNSGSDMVPPVTVMPLMTAFADQFVPPRGSYADALSR
jgi:hypothetical protein